MCVRSTDNFTTRFPRHPNVRDRRESGERDARRERSPTCEEAGEGTDPVGIKRAVDGERADRT
ncbi:hypothetical protein, partial [Halorubrum tibetense]